MKNKKSKGYLLAIVSMLMLVASGILIIREVVYIPEEEYVAPSGYEKYLDMTPGIVTPTPIPTISLNTPLFSTPTPTLTQTTAPDATSGANKTNNGGDAEYTQKPEFVYTGALYPVKLYFIEHELSSIVIPVGIGENGGMDVVDNVNRCAWLAQDKWPLPGDTGNAIIAGHASRAGKKGCFSLLKNMAVGELVAVEFNNNEIRYFKSVKVFETGYDDISIMSATADPGEARLTLITCKGDYSGSIGTSEHRVVAICEWIATDKG